MKIEDVLLGIAIGDAFGAGVEFQDRDWIRQHIDFTSYVNVRHRIPVAPEKLKTFTENFKDWNYTDDTEMTIGLIKALISNAPFTEELLIAAWKAEYDLGIKIKGHGRNGHGSMRWYYDGEKSIEEIRDFQRNRPNPGNAPAMRAVPLGFIDESLINEYAAINARATHPNNNAVISSQCIARATRYILIENGNPKHLISYCLNNVALNSDYQKYLSNVDRLPIFKQFNEEDYVTLCGPQPIEAPYFLPGIKGVPSDSKFTTGCVLYILKHSTNALEALKMAITIGGDVDSLASIATGILAGKTGLNSLPSFMIQQVEGKNKLKQLAQEFEKHYSQQTKSKENENRYNIRYGNSRP